MPKRFLHLVTLPFSHLIEWFWCAVPVACGAREPILVGEPLLVTDRWQLQVLVGGTNALRARGSADAPHGRGLRSPAASSHELQAPTARTARAPLRFA